MPHGSAAGSSKRPSQELHGAAGVVDVGLHLGQLCAAGRDHALDARLVLRPRFGRPRVTAAVARHRAVDLEQLERLLDAALRQVDRRLEPDHRHRATGGFERLEDPLHVDRRRKGGLDEVLGDPVVLAAGEEDAPGRVDRPPGAAHLLVVGDRRARPLVVDDPAEVRLVEAHPERDRRDERLHLTGDQRVLEPLALLGRERRVVGTGVDATRAQPGGDPLRVGDGQAIDDAAAGQVRDVLREPRQPLGLVGERDRPEPERRPCQRAADDPDALPELLGHVRDDPVVGRRRRREDRDRRREAAQDPPDPPVVGPEVVAPVADAVRLVDDEQADRSLDRGKDPVREGLVAEALGRDQQDVDRVCREPRLDVVPLGRVARVDRRGVEAQPAGHRDLVAHEGEERADDERRPVALVAADPRRDPVDEALAPARALDDERPLPVSDHGLDRLALALAELRVGTEHRPEVVVERRGVGLHAPRSLSRA